MRLSLLLVCLLSNVALAQNAPAHDDAKPKGRLIDPFGHMPHPRDGMRLPDPRTAAEKAAADGVVSPDAPPPKSSPAHPEPAPAPPPSTPVLSPPPSTPVPSPPVATSSAAPVSASGSPAASNAAPTPSQITTDPATTGAPAGTFPAFRRSKTPFGVTTMRIKMKHEEETPPTPPRQGGTLQVGLGAGWIYLTSDFASLKSPRGTAGLSLGYGVWLNESVALFLRAAAVAIPYSDGTLTQGFLGPTFQIWPTEATWFGLGLGASMLDVDVDPGGGLRRWALGGDLRVGHTLFERSGHALDISLELSPAAFEIEGGYNRDDVSLVATSIGLLVGYQML